MINVEKFIDKNVNKKDNVTKLSPGLNQGEKFKHYQMRLQNNLDKKHINNINQLEGFDNMIDKSDNNNLGYHNTKTINDNSDKQIVDNLRNEYQDTLIEYKKLLGQLNGTTTNFLDRVNPNNPYIGKNIGFSNGIKFYVTKQGIAKLIPDQNIWDSLNIEKDYIKLDIPWSNDYNIQGAQISTVPPLIVGTPLKYGQSVGNEGSNVFVNKLLPDNISPTYMGCYATSPNNDNMTFIGNKPSLNDVSIQNGTFDQPILKKNTYKNITSSSEVPGWYFKGAILLNNSKELGYPIPYPNGNQCVSIKNTNYISQVINLTIDLIYTIKFSACGRNCCTKPTTTNPIKIDLCDSNNKVITTIYQTTPPVNKWTTYSTTFTVNKSQNYNLKISGTNSTGDRSTAIQDITLNGNYYGTGDYTYEECKIAAVNNGYQYFALQNVNVNTSKGYCAVSNDSPSVTQYGESLIPNKLIILWQTNKLGTGNIATLSKTGALDVVDSTGKSIYSTPSSNAKPSNYLGCYGDKKDRAMHLHNDGSQKYTNADCQKIAKNNGYKYYGLQNSTTGKNAQCAVSNDLNKSTQYGRATNCTKISDGSYSGGGWSNAIYNTTLPESNYYLILQDDGNMCIYRGTGPDDNQGIIWSSNTTGKVLSSNPLMVSSKNKFGKNWMISDSTLAPGDFISSTKGDLVLMMQTDGNLVLYTYDMEVNCKKMNDQNMGGGNYANAAYNIGMNSIPSNMGSVGFIDEDSNLYLYPSDNQTLTNSYSSIEGINSPENDIEGSAFSDATLESCEKACNSISDCAGFALNIDNTYNKTCWPKSKSMYPFGGTSKPDKSINLYIRNKTPLTPPNGVSKNTNNIDSITYQNYFKSDDKLQNKYGLSNVTDIQKQQLDQVETKLNLLSKQINGFTSKFKDGSTDLENTNKTNTSGLNSYLKDLNKTNENIIGLTNYNSNGVNNILNDSDIVVLQKNYNYLFWSILTTATVLVSINILKK